MKPWESPVDYDPDYEQIEDDEAAEEFFRAVGIATKPRPAQLVYEPVEPKPVSKRRLRVAAAICFAVCLGILAAWRWL